MPTIHNRSIEDEDDEWLLDSGWEFAGISLFYHPQFDQFKYHTKEQAMFRQLAWDCINHEAELEEVQDILRNH
jgi:hypothetical protein